jgi:hypothetical protein
MKVPETFELAKRQAERDVAAVGRHQRIIHTVLGDQSGAQRRYQHGHARDERDRPFCFKIAY